MLRLRCPSLAGVWMITVLARSCPKECGGSVQTGSTGLSSHNTDWTGGRLPMSFLLSVTRHALPSGHPQLPLPSCAWPGAERGQGELRGGSLVRRRPEDRRIPQREQIFFQAPLRRDRGRSRGTSRGRRAAQPRSACRRLCTHLPPTGPAGAAAHTPRPRPPPPHPDAASDLPSTGDTPTWRDTGGPYRRHPAWATVARLKQQVLHRDRRPGISHRLHPCFSCAIV